VQNDVLKEYIARGTYIYPPQQAMRIITDLFAWTNENVPEWNTISIRVTHAGSGIDRSAGSGFYVGKRDRVCGSGRPGGLDVDKFAPRLSFFFNAHNNFLEEVASFGPRAGCGRKLCAINSRPGMGARGCCVHSRSGQL